MPPRSRRRTCPGGADPLSRARAAGMRLSRTRAVFPAPDGPATAVSRSTGKAAVRSCRLYRSPISIVICPPVPARPAGPGAPPGPRPGTGPMIECGSVSSCAGGPWAITVPPLRAGPGPDLDDPVRGADDLPLVLHHDHGIAVPGQRRERLAQPGDVAWVQPDRRLVQHVQHARGAGPHRRGELDPLPFPGRQRGTGPVQGQVAQAHVEHRREPAVQLGEQAGGQPAELGGQPRGQAGREARAARPGPAR